MKIDFPWREVPWVAVVLVALANVVLFLGAVAVIAYAVRWAINA